MSRIRVAGNQDRDGIREVHLCAFPDGEAQIVAALACRLLSEQTSPETFSLVAETDGGVVGHIAFSPVMADVDGHCLGYILAPLGVKPGHQRRGIGSELIERGMERLSGKGVEVVFVYGDPDYYGRFGFKAEAAAGYLPPYALKYPFGWLAIALNGERSVEQTLKLSCVASLRDPALW